MPTSATAEGAKALTEQKNLARGVFATLERRRSESVKRPVSDVAKKTKAAKDLQLKEIAKFRYGLRRCLLIARAGLPTRLYNEYLDWFYSQVNRLQRRHANIPIGFDNLNGFVAVRGANIERELTWIAARLEREQKKLTEFRKQANEVDQCFLNKHGASAVEVLAKIAETFGESMWSVQLRIGLEQRFGGLDNQKRYYESIRAQHKRGILAYVAYHTSVRNESKTTINRFHEVVSSRISDRPRYLRNYLRYRILNEWPNTDSGIADVLRGEQSHSIIDIYETFVCLAQETIRRADLGHLKLLIARVLERIEQVVDYRLVKLRSQLLAERDLATLPIRSTKCGDAAINGDWHALAQLSASKHQKHPDPWPIIYSSIALAHGNPGVRPQRANALPIELLLARILARAPTFSQDLSEFERLVANFSALPSVIALRDFVGEVHSTSRDDWLRLHLVNLNSPMWGVEDIGLHSESKLREFLGSMWLGKSAALWREFNENSTELEDPAATILKFARAVRFLREERLQEAGTAIEQVVAETISEPLRSAATLLQIRCSMASGHRTRTIELIAEAAARHPASISLLPIKEALAHFDHKDFKAVGHSLLPLIALDLLLRATDSEATASMLRHATSDFLRKEGKKPSALVDDLEKYSKHQLVYFLRHICIPGVIDISRLFKSSREVLEERQLVCAALNTVDPSNSDNYQNEVFQLTNRLKIADGLRLVDTNRVYVDVDAISRWAHRTISEDFDRYNDLVRAGVGVSDNLEAVIKELQIAARSAKQVFFTPDNEADTILIDLLARLRDEFLNNSNYGFDYFLSKRVRHQSFIGLIRGPLEFANVITNRESENTDYKPNDYWLERCAELDAETRLAMDQAFRKFAGSFDALLGEVKDKEFHVRSHEKAAGLFFIDLTPTILLFARAVAQNQSLDDFLRAIYALFWGLLDGCLVEARRVIGDRLKMQVAHDLDALRASVRTYAERCDAFPELTVTLATVSTEVQNALSQAEGWFTQPEIRRADHHFTIAESLDVAIEYALKLHRGFQPEINRHIPNEGALTVTDFLFINDLVLIAFDNIKSYSKLKKPCVSIEAYVDAETEALDICMLNDVADGVRNDPRGNEKLHKIRELIDQQTTGALTKKEGGSGFLKLAAQFDPAKGGILEFGFRGERAFRLHMRLPLLVRTVDTKPSNDDGGASESSGR